MKIVELRQLADQTEVVFSREEEDPLSIRFETNLDRVREYVSWLNYRIEKLKAVPPIGSLIKFNSRSPKHQYYYNRWFELQVVNHQYSYRAGYGEMPGQWEVSVLLHYPSTFRTPADWEQYMQRNEY